MKFLKLMLFGYLGGMIGMWGSIFIFAFVDPNWTTPLDFILGTLAIPFTPLGLPFFVGMCTMLYFKREKFQ